MLLAKLICQCYRHLRLKRSLFILNCNYLLIVLSIFGSTLLFSKVTSAFCSPNQAVVLVPGFSMASDKYSRKLVQYFTKQEMLNEYPCQIKIIDHLAIKNSLNSLNSLKEKGESLFWQMKKWREQIPGVSTKSIEIVAQGISGLYALQALALNAKEGFPLIIKKISLLSTPLNGLELADLLEKNPKVRDQMLVLFKQNYPGIDLDSLLNLQTSNVKDFLKTLKIPEDIEINLYAGVQSSPQFNQETLAQINHFLPPILQAFDFLIEVENDGLVSRSSALTAPSELQTLSGEPFTHFISHPEFRIPFNHIQQSSIEVLSKIY